MQLADYLKRENLTHENFAEVIGVDRSVVTRWRQRKTIPEEKNMRLIAEATKGAVTANDFYEIETVGSVA